MSEYCVYYRETGIGKNLSVGHFVPPADAKDAAKTLHVETVHLLLLLGIGCPDFTSVQDGDDYVCVIQRRLGWRVSLGFSQTREVSRPRVVAAFRIELLISTSKDRLSLMVEPR